MIPSITTDFKFLSMDPTPDFQLVEANIRFLKKLHGIVELTKANGEEKPVKIYCYSNVTKLRTDFNFHKHGFQFCALDSKVMEFAHEFMTSPSGAVGRQNKQYILDWANQFLSSWGKENGIQGKVACVNFNYRSANLSDGAQPPFFLAHADYAENNMVNTMQELKSRWKPLIEKVTGPLSEEKYRALKINAMVNLWMPLNQLPTVNTLALMDISSSENLLDELKPATIANYTSLGLEARAHQKWVVQTEMPLGNAVIFNTFKTPHTAVDIPGRFQEEHPCDEYRKSIEMRGLYFEDPN